jgi:tetratricopeptide (TPR) repeat protein
MPSKSLGISCHSDPISECDARIIQIYALTTSEVRGVFIMMDHYFIHQQESMEQMQACVPSKKENPRQPKTPLRDNLERSATPTRQTPLHSPTVLSRVLNPQTTHLPLESNSNNHFMFEEAARAGESHLTKGDYGQALVYFRKALLHKRHSIDKETPETKAAFAEILYTIGRIHMVIYRDAAKSIQAFHFSLDLRRACLGPTHPLVVNVLYKLAEVYASIDEAETAVEILSETLAILLASDCESHALADVWMNLGQQLHRLGRKEEALASFEESRRIFDALKTTELCTQLESDEGRAPASSDRSKGAGDRLF